MYLSQILVSALVCSQTCHLTSVTKVHEGREDARCRRTKDVLRDRDTISLVTSQVVAEYFHAVLEARHKS